MATHLDFPYINQIFVHDCYAFKNLVIPAKALGEFKHIILTGKNGTGKTTILKNIAVQFNEYKTKRVKNGSIRYYEAMLEANPDYGGRLSWLETIKNLNSLTFTHLNDDNLISLLEIDSYVFSYFQASRKVMLPDVVTVTKEVDFIKDIQNNETSEVFSTKFKQYLVNKKVYDAFDFMNSKTEKVSQNNVFFSNLPKYVAKSFYKKDLSQKFSDNIPALMRACLLDKV